MNRYLGDPQKLHYNTPIHPPKKKRKEKKRSITGGIHHIEWENGYSNGILLADGGRYLGGEFVLDVTRE